jgi:hypothetical protein
MKNAATHLNTLCEAIGYTWHCGCGQEIAVLEVSGNDCVRRSIDSQKSDAFQNDHGKAGGPLEVPRRDRSKVSGR